MTDNSPFSQLVTFMTAQDGMAAILITLHSDDGTGHCRQCTSGAQAGRHVWPCQTYLAASSCRNDTVGIIAHDRPVGTLPIDVLNVDALPPGRAGMAGLARKFTR